MEQTYVNGKHITLQRKRLKVINIIFRTGHENGGVFTSIFILQFVSNLLNKFLIRAIPASKYRVSDITHSGFRCNRPFNFLSFP